MRNAVLDEAQAGIKIARRNINNLRYAEDTNLMAENQSGTEEPLDEGERGEWKSWLKTQHSKNEDHGIQSHHFMEKKGKQWKQWQIFFSLGPKLNADGGCSHEIKRRLLLGRKAMTKLDRVLKSRRYFAGKVLYS